MNKKPGNSYGSVSAGLILSGVLGLAGNSYGTEEALALDRFELKIVEYTAGGNEILAGNFSGAIGKIQSSLSLDSKYEKNTNLCAAYTAQKAFANAEAHCQTALRLSRTAQTTQMTNSRYMSTRSRQAMALNNFGVWHALQGNTEEASEYFEAANNKSRRISTTTQRNINALEQRLSSKVMAA
jgi:tetratricopeptide (TPR) repeat protein